MPDTRSGRVESSDAELIAAVREGDTESYGLLFDRHREAATRLSRQLVRGPDADDLVAESFIRVLAVLQAGKGPDESFRAYLLTSIRRLHIDQIRREKRVRSTDDEAELDRAVEFVDPAEMKFEQSAAATAYASLPERWQLVLWHLDVEGQKPADVAPLLGMSANSVSALAYRAREGLRQAYLQSHLSPSLHASCRTATGLLGSYVRKGLSARDSARVESHLDECSRCTGLFLELSEINSNLSGILGPALLGTAAAGYFTGGSAAALAGAGGGAGTATGAQGAMAAAVETALVPVKFVGAAVVGAGTQGVVAAAVVVTVAAAGTVALTTDLGGSAKERPEASAPVTTVPTPIPSTDAPTEPTPTETTETTDTTAIIPLPPEPSAEPTEVPVEPEADEPDPDPTTTRETKPEPTPEPILPTDYAITSVQVTNDSTLLQRRFTIGIGASNPGRAKAQLVTVTMAFIQPVVFRGVVSPGWSCGPATVNRTLSTLTCTQTLGAGEGTTFIAKAIGLGPSGTVTVTAPGDPVGDNNAAPFSSGLWPIS